MNPGSRPHAASPGPKRTMNKSEASSRAGTQRTEQTVTNGYRPRRDNTLHSLVNHNVVTNGEGGKGAGEEE